MRPKRTLRWFRSLFADLKFAWRDHDLGLPSLRAARRAAANGFYMGNGIILTRVLGRHILYLPTRDTSLVPGLLLHGWWEPQVTRTLAALLRPGMVVGDVGANVGYFSVLMASRVGPNGRLYAFEPNGDLVSLVNRSLFVNGLTERTVLHELALGADEREMLLCFPGDALGGAAIAADPGHEVADSRRVRMQRLDSIPGADAIELLKIDAEGSEPAIWAGMEGLLRGSALRTVLIEFSGAAYDDPEAFLASIAAAGFTMRLIDYDRGVIPTDRAWLLAPERRNTTLMLLLTR